MTRRKIIAYYRVSTQTQGADGLGMAAQREAVHRYAERCGLPILAAYEEVETGRKPDLRNRPQLAAAVGHARRSRALLVIARLDRLARNVFVTSQLMESGVNFVACDAPYASRLTIHILAAMAEHESALISDRIRAANAAARARGVDFRRPENRLSPQAQRLGTIAANRETIERSARVYCDLVPIVKDLRKAGLSLRKSASALIAMGHRTQRGTMWRFGTLYNLMRREGISAQPPATWIGSSTTRRDQVAMTARRYVDILAEVRRLRYAGRTLQQVAAGLNAQSVTTFRGRPWTAAGLVSLMQRQGSTFARTVIVREAERCKTF